MPRAVRGNRAHSLDQRGGDAIGRSMTRHCTNCGVLLKLGASFCHSCGARQAVKPRPSPLHRRLTGSAGPTGPEQPIPADEPALTAAPLRSGGPVGGLSGAHCPWGQKVWDTITVAGSGAMGDCGSSIRGWPRRTPTTRAAPPSFCCRPCWCSSAARSIGSSSCRSSHRRPIPGLIRIGIGLAIPFLVANYLYASGSSQFESCLRTVVISTLLSYLVLRRPSAWERDQAWPFPGRESPRDRADAGARISGAQARVPGAVAYADDCGQDITRAEDCLRTPGIATGIATGVSTVVNVLLNGASIAGGFPEPWPFGDERHDPHDSPPDGSEPGDNSDDEHKKVTYTLRASHAERASVASGGRRRHPLAVRPGELHGRKRRRRGAHARAAFSRSGPDADWLLLSDAHMGPDGFKAILAHARSPSATATPPTHDGARITVSVTSDMTSIMGDHSADGRDAGRSSS